MEATINQYKITRLITEAQNHGCRYIAINREANTWYYSPSRKSIETSPHMWYNTPDIKKPGTISSINNSEFSRLCNEGKIKLIEILKNRNINN